MKLRYFLIVLSTAMLFSACETDQSVGLNIRPEKDAIKVVVDTFWAHSTDYAVPAISAQCSDTLSILLGEYYSKKYGATKAELIVQLAPPIDYEFPDPSYNPQPDSLVLLIYYKSWFGSKIEPLEISIYELNKSTPEYHKVYMSDLSISEFTDATDAQLLGRRVMTSIDQTLDVNTTNSSSFVPSVSYKFDEAQLKRFFNMPISAYTSTEAFLKAFPGLYLTTTYGQSTMLYLREINLRLYYHYTYKKNGVDTVINTYITYPANKEVRQLNKFSHPNIQEIINKRDSVNYLKSTGGIFSKIELPLGAIRQQVADSIGDKLLMLNSAQLSIEQTEFDSSATAMPIPAYLMMIKEAELNDFLTSNQLFHDSDSSKIIGVYDAVTRHYVFDITYLLSKDIKRSMTDFSQIEHMVLIPVYRPTSSVNAFYYKPLKRLSAFTFRSGRNSYSPLRLELVYSGF